MLSIFTFGQPLVRHGISLNSAFSVLAKYRLGFVHTFRAHQEEVTRVRWMSVKFFGPFRATDSLIPTCRPRQIVS